MGVSETVLAAMIGACATVATALFQLISNFRSSSAERRTNSKRGGGLRSLMWTVALILAAGVGGFAYAEYRSQNARDETRALRTELQSQMQALQASTARLEQMRLAADGNVAAPAPGSTSNAAVVTVSACRGALVGFATERARCTEQEALQIAVCASVPANAQVTGVELYSRAEDAQIAWPDARISAGQDIGSGRFAESHVERSDSEQGKLVCQTFAHWGDKGRTLRILVRYSNAARTPG